MSIMRERCQNEETLSLLSSQRSFSMTTESVRPDNERITCPYRMRVIGES